MKKLFFLGILVLTISFSFAQTNTFPANGNVGIGTSTPSHALTVNGEVKLTTVGQGYLIYYTGLSETVGGASTILGNNIKVGNSINTVKRFMNPSDAGSFVSLNYINGITFHTGLESVLNTEISSSENEKMRITHSGNLGIGTAYPENKLTVKGSNVFVDVQSEGNQEAGLWMRRGNSSYGGTKLYYNTGDAVTYLDNLYLNTTGSTYGSFSIRSKNNQDQLVSRLFVQGSDGNIGIGTVTPSSKLAVNGKIRAHEIKVENTNWPDYVFKSDYNLPTLQETEQHIKEKGHLPGIPSAAEVKANGIDLGEMNAKLLQKVEELTLHLIEKEKAINILINKVNLLEEKVR